MITPKVKNPNGIERVLLLAASGSNAYGINVEGSDSDVVVIYAPTPHAIFGIGSTVVPEFEVDNQRNISLKEWAANVTSKGGTDVSEALFVAEEDIFIQHPLFAYIRSNRNIFVTKVLAESFIGYAKNMKMRSVGVRQKRPEESPKWAAHAHRTAQMALELAETGICAVKRPDAEYLLAIRNGVIDLDSALAEFEDLYEKAKVAIENSALPKEPDRELISELLISTFISFFQEQDGMVLDNSAERGKYDSLVSSKKRII